jgi:high-affinity nickel permease
MEIYKTLTRHEHAAREALIKSTQQRIRLALLAERVYSESTSEHQLDVDELDAIDTVCRKLI